MTNKTTRTFGVEFELIISINDLLSMISISKSDEEMLRFFNIDEKVIKIIRKPLLKFFYEKGIVVSPGWKIVYDGSIEPKGKEIGFEIISPPLSIGGGGLQEITKFMQKVKQYGFYVNKSTGLHVHVDGKEFINKKDKFDMTQKIMIALMSYKSIEKLFDELVIASRRKNKNSFAFSPPKEKEIYNTYKDIIKFDEKNISIILSLFQDGRYYKLNLESLLKHGTMEFRGMHGTLNEKLVVGWIQIAIEFIEQVLKTEKDLKSYFITINQNRNAALNLIKQSIPKKQVTNIIGSNKLDQIEALNSILSGEYKSFYDLSQKEEDEIHRVALKAKNGLINDKKALEYIKAIIDINQQNLKTHKLYKQTKNAFNKNALAEKTQVFVN